MPHEIEPRTLRKLLHYDKESGHLFWNPRMPDLFSDTPKRSRERNASWWNGRFAGKRACKPDANKGYLRVGIFGNGYRAHRVIWAMETNNWPTDTIDHIDGYKNNNILENLREATQAENNRNRRNFGHSKYRGVGWRKGRGLWAAAIKSDGKTKFLGYFNSEEAAAQAYDRAAIQVHREFARLNFPQAHHVATILSAFGVQGGET